MERTLRTAASQTINYTYDDINQLTGETSTETTPLVDNSYSYDDAGNRLTSSTGGTASTFTLDEMNQISGYTFGGNAVTVDYDANGNTTQLGFQTMAYDDADRLTSVIQKNPLTGDNVKKMEYEYDGLSRRRVSTTYTWNAGNQTWDQQDERHFIYDGMDLIQERDGSNNVIASYVRDGNIGGVLSRTTSSGTSYYHYDGNGNVVAMTNSSGAIVAEYMYDAYGNVISMSGSQAADNPIRFSTKYFDINTGYYDFGFRSYDPITGRWLNRDPIGESGGLNLYGFVRNSPGNYLDSYGLDYLYAQAPGGGFGFGSHARIWVQDANGRTGTWYGFYPNETGKATSGPGFLKMADNPDKGWSKSSTWIQVNISATDSKKLRKAIADSMRPKHPYVLEKYNCSTWAGQVVTSIFPDIGSQTIRTPISLINALEGSPGAGTKHVPPK